MITTAMIKTLRERTSAGLMDCKKALGESGGDLDAAADWLRKKGLADAARKAGRVAAEGLVAVALDGRQGVLVELNAETDFVSRSAEFRDLARWVAGVALAAGGDADAVLEAEGEVDNRPVKVADRIREAISTIGENMALRRVSRVQAANGRVVPYLHNAAGPGLGRIGVLVAVETDGEPSEMLEGIGRQIAMHVAASRPLSVSEEDLDPAELERERRILTEQALESGKPEAVVEKMIAGRLKKFVKESCLLRQPFVMDVDVTVDQALRKAGDDLGARLAVGGFARFALGEGIEKREEDFAAEVAAVAGG